MPLSGDSMAIINAAGQLAGQAVNYAAQNNISNKTKEYNREMYATQRADALKDWTSQNEYNSPSSQMARLKAAGLNPNLVYGHGADTTSGPVRSSSANSWNPQAPQTDLGSVTGAYFSTKLQQAQYDNLKAQNTVLLNDAALKASQKFSTDQQTATSRATADKLGVDTQNAALQLGINSDLRENTLSLAQTQLEGAKQGVAKTIAETNVLVRRDLREALSNAQSLNEGLARIGQIMASTAKTKAELQQVNQGISNLQKDSELKELDLKLKRAGIQPSDPVYLRMLTQFLNSTFGQNLLK